MKIALLLLLCLVSLVAGWRSWKRLRHFLHLFQLEGYKLNEFRIWLRRRIFPTLIAPSHIAGAIVLSLLGIWNTSWTALFALAAWLVIFASDALYSGRAKKPLAFTSRLKRLLALSLILAALPLIVTFGAATIQVPHAVLLILAGWLLVDLGAPIWVMLAGLIAMPIEKSIQNGFKRQAKKRLAERSDLTIVGITGSYGKTSTKFATAEILRQRFNTLATPSSYNTPMGFCLVVNNQLRPDHRVLVLEYGIRYTGDMKDLTNIARPDIAIVSSIGVAHLESMGTVENIAKEKGGLIAALKPNGTAILNGDDPLASALADRAPAGTTIVRVSARGDHSADLWAEDVQYGREGATFTVQTNDSDSEKFTTRLLGEHNVLNILLGLATGRAMDLRLRQLVPAVERIEPVAHRLALRNENGILVIDDAFNANPVGSKNAVDILAQFDGRRTIITPGMVELGERHEIENRAFGKHIGEKLGPDDLVILVGPKQTEPIQQGLQDAGYPQESIRIVRSLFDAQDIIRTELRTGDVVLYENDLPDQYGE